MSALSAWRGLIRAAAPRGFLRRDQGDGLFVSDYPRFPEAAATTARLLRAGFSVSLRGTLARIDASLPLYRSLPAAPPPPPPLRDDSLAVYCLGLRFLRCGGAVQSPCLPLLRLTLKCLDNGDYARLLREAPPLAARAQREGAVLPAAAGRLIFEALQNAPPVPGKE